MIEGYFGGKRVPARGTYIRSIADILKLGDIRVKQFRILGRFSNE